MLLHANEPLIVDSGGYALIGERREGANSEREAEANAFAAALLMPVEWVAQALKGRQIDVADGDGVSKLAKEFGVSQQAMMYRLVNLGYAENL
jgi:Zn-dependent peptidase ImmA (M78 family)